MRGGVEFAHDGRRYVMRFGANQLCAAEEASGRRTLELVNEIQSGAGSFRTFRVLFWAGLGTVTVEQAGEMMDAIGLQEVAEIIGKALTLAFPDPEAGRGDPGNAGAATA